MESFEAHAAQVTLLFYGRHKLVGRQNSIMAKQSVYLCPERDKSEEIDQAQHAQKKPAHEKIVRRFHVPAPTPAGKSGEKRAVFRNHAICPFGKSRKNGQAVVSAQQPLPVGIFGQRPEHSLRARINHTVGRNELNRRVKARAGNFGKLFRNARVLRGQIIHRLARQLLPAANPEAAKMAVTVKDH